MNFVVHIGIFVPPYYCCILIANNLYTNLSVAPADDSTHHQHHSNFFLRLFNQFDYLQVNELSHTITAEPVTPLASLCTERRAAETKWPP